MALLSSSVIYLGLISGNITRAKSAVLRQSGAIPRARLLLDPGGGDDLPGDGDRSERTGGRGGQPAAQEQADSTAGHDDDATNDGRTDGRTYDAANAGVDRCRGNRDVDSGCEHDGYRFEHAATAPKRFNDDYDGGDKRRRVGDAIEHDTVDG